MQPSNSFNPTWYWTGNPYEDAERINRPHITKEGEDENRIADTLQLLLELQDFKEFTLTDAFNIQNYLLQRYNWKGIVPGLRKHNVGFDDTPDWTIVPQQLEHLFPVTVGGKVNLLLWYTAIQTVHPLSDLNGRVFGIIVSVLYKNYKKQVNRIGYNENDWK